jgi:hypothetical protein
LVEGGNEERCGGPGHLIGGGGRTRGVVLRMLFSALVVVNEACMGLHECHQMGVGRVSIPYYVNQKGKKNHHCTRVMVRTSSHVLIFFSLRVGGSTQGGGIWL